MKKSTLKSKRNNLKIFHVWLLFQAVTEGCSNHCATKINAHTVLTPFPWSDECMFKRVWETSRILSKKKEQRQRNQNKKLLHQWQKKCKWTNKCEIIIFFVVIALCFKKCASTTPFLRSSAITMVLPNAVVNHLHWWVVLTPWNMVEWESHFAVVVLIFR